MPPPPPPRRQCQWQRRQQYIATDIAVAARSNSRYIGGGGAAATTRRPWQRQRRRQYIDMTRHDTAIWSSTAIAIALRRRCQWQRRRTDHSSRPYSCRVMLCPLPLTLLS